MTHPNQTPSPSDIRQEDVREEIHRVLTRYFYTGEPGEHDAIVTATDVLAALSAQTGEPVAWRYKCRDGSEVLMLKRLTDEQKQRGYYTGEDGEDEVDGDEAIVGPFHWAEETPLYASPPPQPDTAPSGYLKQTGYID